MCRIDCNHHPGPDWDVRKVAVSQTLIQQAADRMADAITELLGMRNVGDPDEGLRRLEKSRNDYQDACDLDELPPMQEARIRGSVPWYAGRN